MEKPTWRLLIKDYCWQDGKAVQRSFWGLLMPLFFLLEGLNIHIPKKFQRLLKFKRILSSLFLASRREKKAAFFGNLLHSAHIWKLLGLTCLASATGLARSQTFRFWSAVEQPWPAISLFRISADADRIIQRADMLYTGAALLKQKCVAKVEAYPHKQRMGPSDS